jgi:NhaP-type Na+/H+ or K+/H+ antiporter
VLIAVASVEVDIETPGYWVGFTAAQIGFGILIGALAGYLGGRLIDNFAHKGWVDGAFRQLGTLAIGVAAFGTAEIVGGNGFVSAFVAGLAFGAAAREQCEGAYDFAEDEGQLLALLTFLLFGATIAGPALGNLTWQIAVYVLASLTAIRMIPVALALTGMGLERPTIAFVGWFGPRGLASILFGLLLLEGAQLPAGEDIVLVVTWTVVASVVAHGATAASLSNAYGRWFERTKSSEMPEAIEVEMMPTR